MPDRNDDAGSALQRLSRRLGIETRYHDQYGNWHLVPDATLRALCATLGAAGDPAGALAELERRQATELPPTIVVAADRMGSKLRLPLPGTMDRRRWTLREENGCEHHGQLRGDRPIHLPRLAPGYHRLEIAGRHGHAPLATMLVAAPRRAYMPPRLRDQRVWGLSAQLYAVRSARNWGVGDFSDLSALAARAAAVGADVIGVNPLHALFPDQPERASPYSPSSRLFVNPLYLDLEAIEDFAECPEAQRLVAGRAHAMLRRRLRDRSLVDYSGVSALKHPIAELLYRSFRRRHLAHRGDARAAEFRAYQKRGGIALRRFAIFHALRNFCAAKGQARGWHGWPARFRDPGSAAVAAFARRHIDEIESLEYQQWQAERQLARAANSARDAMAVGLYQDLAVGFDPDGADAWCYRDMVAQGWNIGAPPDAWSPKGQDWGLAPLNPQRLRAAGYAPLIETLRASMRYAGALRIDHILGLKRLFWVPQGGSPADGAYVKNPFAELLGIVALESVRQRCLVIGEDLGTVPPGFSETLQRRGILSYRLLYFSRDARGGFLPPHHYPRRALAAIGTHDLPTFAGYWHGYDIALRKRLALYPERGHARRDQATRESDRRAMTAALRMVRLPVRRGEIPAVAAHRFVARSPACIVMAQIEDLLALTDQVNVPGTVDQHPNWRRKIPLEIDAIFDTDTSRQITAALADERPSPLRAAAQVPRATYRLQFNQDFPFDAATGLVPYLARLGVSHLYLSPVLEAQKGSAHGYDVTSFERLNLDLGGDAGFRRLAAAAQQHGLKILLDFVPNHMGIGQARNEWWLDLLERGRHSPAAEMFDIDWAPTAWPELSGKLTVPLLGAPYDEVVARGELTPRFDSAAGTFAVWYHEHCFPIQPADYPPLLQALAAELPAGTAARRLKGLAADFAGLERAGSAPQAAARMKAALARWAAKHAKALPSMPLRSALSSLVLDGLLRRQSYRLAFWRTAGERINYRRFFDINQLASLRMERRAVFDRCHQLIAQLVEEHLVHGIRLDHVDGLYDPGEYCRRLRRAIPKLPYVVVEKILGSDEDLPGDWPVEGTTGYEFANWVNGLFVAPGAAPPLTQTYRRFTGRHRSFADEVHAAKYQVVQQLFGGELAALAARIAQLDPGGSHGRDAIAAVLTDLIAEFPIYRTYIGRRGAAPSDRRILAAVVARIGRHRPSPHRRTIRFVHAILSDGTAHSGEARDIAVRFQQLTAPVQAKAVEDTTFYRYGRLLSLNEVGGDPGRFGLRLADFHVRMRQQARRWPHSLLATATHDTKRGEDARARISVLSEMPAEWQRRVARWSALNRAILTKAGGERAPSANDEYILYQTLLGAWPMALIDQRRPDRAALGNLADRLTAYIQKAVREAKLRSSWLDPDAAYEYACQDFVRHILDPARARAFLQDFTPFAAEVARCGALNSLSQVTLKLMAPGVPDIYRGGELWDLSLVDPDNRRPVAFDERRRMLDEMSAGAIDIGNLAADWRSGRLKLYLTWRLLALRRARPALFAAGSYEPLSPRGPAARHVIAFRRRQRRSSVIVVAGRWFAGLAPGPGGFAPAPRAWRGTTLSLAQGNEPAFTDVLTGRRVATPVRLDDLFRDLPVAVLSSGP